MTLKVLTILLLSMSFAFANSETVKDTSQIKNHDPFTVNMIGIGYTSSNKIDISSISYTGNKYFNTDRLLFDITLLRLDLYYKTRDKKKIAEVSYGSTITNMCILGYYLFNLDSKIWETAVPIAFWLSSGSSKFILLGDNSLGIALTESHVFEWFFKSTEDEDGDKNYAFNEVGFVEEVGVQFNLSRVFLTSGISIEKTNKRSNFSWFVRIFTWPIFFD